MDVPVSSFLGPFLALAAMLLGISLLVQVLQELWKFATSSKAIAFEKALDDFAGTWATHHLRQDTALAVRGPFQFRRVANAGHVLPTEKNDLLASLEQAAPVWHRLVDSALAFEAWLQKGSVGEPSPKFTELVDKLQREVEGVQASPQALDVYQFLESWGLTGGAFDAAKARGAFRDRFFGHLARLDQHYDRLMQNFQYAYERRNLRQTFTLALLVALAFNLPLGDVYRRASAMPLAEAVVLSERAAALQAEYEELDAEQRKLPEADSAAAARIEQEKAAIQEQEARLRSVADRAFELSAGRSINTDFRSLWRSLRANVTSASQLLGCLLTAVLVSFGAPFWNDVSSALYRIARPIAARRQDAA
jgi:hypothetical protein